MLAGARYGVDGWPYLVGLGGASVVLAAGAWTLRGRRPSIAVALGAGSLLGALPAALGGRYVLHGKLALRDRLLDEVPWNGDEVVADLGAGAGLLAVGAAHRTSATVHAVDVFVRTDLSSNTPDRLQDNAERAGVARRLVVHRRDVRETGLPTAGIDVVVSTLCLHNLATAADRRRALDEVVRIIRPGGTVAISDLDHVDGEYAPHLRSRGFVGVRVRRAPGTFPPQRLLVARAPLADRHPDRAPGTPD